MDDFKVGDYATECLYSDRNAYEIVARTAKTLTLRRLKVTLLNGPNSDAPDALHHRFVGHTSGEQRYSYASQPEGHTRRAHWSTKRDCFRTRGGRIIAGAHEHYDFNF